MSEPVIRVDYAACGQVGAALDEAALRMRLAGQRLDAAVFRLKAGGWEGEAATALFHSMDHDVLPAVSRLHRALALAGDTARAIVRCMQVAEDEAAAALRWRDSALPLPPSAKADPALRGKAFGETGQEDPTVRPAGAVFRTPSGHGALGIPENTYEAQYQALDQVDDDQLNNVQYLDENGQVATGIQASADSNACGPIAVAIILRKFFGDLRAPSADEIILRFFGLVLEQNTDSDPNNNIRLASGLPPQPGDVLPSAPLVALLRSTGLPLLGTVDSARPHEHVNPRTGQAYSVGEFGLFTIDYLSQVTGSGGAALVLVLMDPGTGWVTTPAISTSPTVRHWVVVDAVSDDQNYVRVINPFNNAVEVYDATVIVDSVTLAGGYGNIVGVGDRALFTLLE